MENLEIEYKVMIEKQDFEKIISELNPNEYCLYVQENTYFDTPDLKIKQNHMSLRIRFIENLNRYLLTLKTKVNDAHLEHEVDVLNHQVSSIDLKTKEILKQHHIDVCDLKEIGKLKTIRYELKTLKYTLCFDHSFYQNKEDFEVECEAQSMDEAKHIVQEYLTSRKISYQPSLLSKVARAVKGER